MRGFYILDWVLQLICIILLSIFTHFKLILPIILCIICFILLLCIEFYVMYSTKQVVAYIKILSNLNLSSDSSSDIKRVKEELRGSLSFGNKLILKYKFGITIK